MGNLYVFKVKHESNMVSPASKKRVVKTFHYRIPERSTRENGSTKLQTDFKKDSAVARSIGRFIVANTPSGRIGVISVTRRDVKVELSLSCTSASKLNAIGRSMVLNTPIVRIGTISVERLDAKVEITLSVTSVTRLDA